MEKVTYTKYNNCGNDNIHGTILKNDENCTWTTMEKKINEILEEKKNEMQEAYTQRKTT